MWTRVLLQVCANSQEIRYVELANEGAKGCHFELKELQGAKAIQVNPNPET